VLGVFECKRECRKFLLGAEPDEAAFAHVDMRLEDIRMQAALQAVDAVGGDDQVRVRKIRRGADLVLKGLPHAERRGPLLQDVQQPLARDAAKSVAAAADQLPAEMHIDVVPMIEAVDDGVMRLRIDIAKSGHRLVGEHDAPAERVVRPVALVHFDERVGQCLLEKDRRIQARGAAAETDDAFH